MTGDSQLRLLCVLAHPDDETLGTGGTLAKYAAEGIATYLVVATRGEYGWFGPPDENPGPDALGRIREQELRAAARVLGLREVHFLDYIDGSLDEADPQEAIERIACHMRRIRPHVVLSFGPDGAYGHPDHIAISQLTAGAIVRAASGDMASNEPPHAVAKLYYLVGSREHLELYQSVFGEISMSIDGQRRAPVGWEDWAITSHIDARPYWRTVWDAVRCHRTQIATVEKLQLLSEAEHRGIWGTQTYYRVFSLVNGGRAQEDDLFAGLRRRREASDIAAHP